MRPTLFSQALQWPHCPSAVQQCPGLLVMRNARHHRVVNTFGIYDWGGSSRGLKLCYLDIDGRIPYAVAPTPPEETRRQEAEDKARKARGEPPPIRLNMPWFYTASEYDSRVQAWVRQSRADLKLTPELRQRFASSRSAAHWRARKQAFNDAAPWVLGLCAFIWLLTAVVGWIVRGFAGVPQGQDFKVNTKARD